MIPALFFYLFAAGSGVLAAVASPRDSADGLAGTVSTRASCASYEVQSNDTCFTIASATNVTWAQLTSWNPSLSGTCSNIQSLKNVCVSNPSGSYSMPTNTNGTVGIVTTIAAIPSPTVSGTNSKCGQWALVNSGDDCSTITDQYSIDLTDFLFLNPEVWPNCTNLYLDYYYCVEAVGYISTYPGYLTTSTTSALNQTSATSLPSSNSNPLTNVTMSAQLIPLANGTRFDCANYVWFDSTAGNPGADCWNVAFAYGQTREELVLWNPSLANNNASDSSAISVPSGANLVGAAAATATAATSVSTSSNAYNYPCTLSANSSYCVNLVTSTIATSASTSVIVTPTPVAAGESQNCTSWFTPTPDTVCANILIAFQITMAEFYTMNPSVGTDCSGLNAGTYYCVSTNPDGQLPAFTDTGSGTLSFVTTFSGWVSETTTTAKPTGVVTPSPIQTGMVNNCNKFYDVQSGDSCAAIQSSYNIAFTQLYNWNPAIGSNCQYLDVGDYICVGVSSTTTITKTTATKQPTGVVTPSPIQTGMVNNCNKFYDVQSGDSCAAIQSSYSITFAQLYSWNPAIGSNCQYLDVGDYICVGVLSTTITKTTTTKQPTGVVTPSPIQTGMVNNCNKFYDIKSGDSCAAIQSSYSITFAQLYSWNPAIGSNCQYLDVGDYICVGIL